MSSAVFPVCAYFLQQEEQFIRNQQEYYQGGYEQGYQAPQQVHVPISDEERETRPKTHVLALLTILYATNETATLIQKIRSFTSTVTSLRLLVSLASLACYYRRRHHAHPPLHPPPSLLLPPPLPSPERLEVRRPF